MTIDERAMRAYDRVAKKYQGALTAVDDSLGAARGIARGCVVGIALWIMAGIATCAYFR